MGYADGYYYGQGKIICDTATFTAGDTIRVRSMTDATKIWDKTVVTAGTPLIFDVPGKDYYKICTVQEISDVETEIGGVYKTIDYGQTLFINVLDKTSLQGIQGILNAHQQANMLEIGDRTYTTINGNPWAMLVAGINIDGQNSVTLSSEFAWESTQGRAAYPNPATYTDSLIRTKAQSFYTAMTEADKLLVKEVTKATLNSAGGAVTYSDKSWIMAQNDLSNVYPLYTTQASRIKKEQTGVSNVSWWTSTGTRTTSNNGWMPVQADGSIAQGSNWPYQSTNYVVPCIVLQADA